MTIKHKTFRSAKELASFVNENKNIRVISICPSIHFKDQYKLFYGERKERKKRGRPETKYEPTRKGKRTVKRKKKR